jgi:hypothetical protein
MLKDVIIAAADLAEAARAMNRYSRRSGSVVENWPIFAVIGAIALLWAGLYYWDKHRKTIVLESKTPQSLFDELCRVHKLSRADIALLAKASVMDRLKHPATAFVDPGVLRRAEISDGGDGYRRLRLRLFAD